MKKSILLSISILLHQFTIAQPFKYVPANDANTPNWAKTMYAENANVHRVEQLRAAYYNQHDYKKNIHEQNYKHWRTLMEPYLDEHGNIHPDRNFNNSQRTGGGAANWMPVGPMETYTLGSQGSIPVSWQCNIYCFDQSLSDPDMLLAGVEGGDLFRSTDKGLTWTAVTEQLSVASPTAVKIAPSNANVAYFCANNTIYKTEDGGTNWTNVYSVSGGIYEIMVHPTDPNTVFIVGGNGAWSSTNGGTSWNQLQTEKCWDIRYHATNASILFLLMENPTLKRAEIFRSTDGGVNWNLEDTGWYIPSDPANASTIGGKIGVTAANPNYIYAALIGQSKADDNGWIGVYKSTDAGLTWSNPLGQDGGPYDGEDYQNLATINRNGTGFHQGFYNFAFGVSANNADRFWVGALALTQSNDGGQTFQRIGSYNSQPDGLSWIHPDIQDFTVQGNDIWVMTDGGINYSNDELLTHESRKYGIYNSTFWGYGQGWNADIMVGGRYHNGNSGYFQTYNAGDFLRLGGAESPTGHVNPLLERKVYFDDIGDHYLPATLDGPRIGTANMGIYPTGSYWTSGSSELEFDPRYAGHLFLGSENGFWGSTTEGAMYTNLYSFPTSHEVLEIEISRQNPDIMYCVVRGSGSSYLSGSADGGQTWNTLTTLPSGDPSRAEISMNPENSDELWVIVANSDRVFRTLDGGSSWIDLSTATIDGHQLKDIRFQAGSDVAYIASNTDVFYWNSAQNDWVQFSDGLPARLNTYELCIFYRDSKIRLIDKGKGIWESDLIVPSLPIAQPMTFSDVVSCSRDTVLFDCHSILDHNGASWDWSFSPQPQFVSATDVRNPKVYFGQNGTFDVTLTITDGNGNTSTRTELAMVTVESLCEADSVPGMCMESSESGGYAGIPDLGVTTNTFTITAWVRPDGIQPDYSGIAMANGSAAGFNFVGGNNSLGYHWPGGGQWWWNSGLVVPDGEWSYVAFVITPSDVTLYLNGIASSQNISLPPATIGSMLLGSYLNWGSRYYTGQMDEVRIWDRALSQNEIRELRHVTLTQQMMDSDADLLAYYQFNETDGQILDRKGIRHAALSGTAQRVSSDGPFAKGEVDRVTIGFADVGNTLLPETASSVSFANSTTVPEGEIVVSRLHWLPNALPNTAINFDGYFIINNYGNNQLAQANELVLKPFAFDPSPQLLSGSAVAPVYFRSENEHESTWINQCGSASVSTDGIVYDQSCALVTNGQFFPNTDLFVQLTENREAEVSVYPNPVAGNGSLTLKNPLNEAVRFTLFSANGKLVKSETVAPSQTATILLNMDAAGVYMYSVRGDSFIKNGKVVVR